MRWLMASKGYTLKKRKVWAAFKRFLGCVCIFSLNNGTFGGSNFRKGMGVRPTHFTHLNIHANFVNFGTNQNQA